LGSSLTTAQDIILTMKSYVFTLGFHEDYIERRLYMTKASREDVIVLFTCKPAVGAVIRAYEGLKLRTTSLGISQPLLVEISCDNPAEAISEARKIIRELPEPIIADLSGGMRIAVILIYTALLLENKEFELKMQSESEPAIEAEIPYPIIKLIKNPLSREKQEILAEIMKNPGITAKELALKLGKKEKTILNHIAELKKHQLVVQKGKYSGLYPTKWTKIATLI